MPDDARSLTRALSHCREGWLDRAAARPRRAGNRSTRLPDRPCKSGWGVHQGRAATK
jgi:hypothetical protein